MRTIVGLLLALSLCLSAQTPLAFEAASIKPAPPDRGSAMYYRTPPGGRVSISNATLKLLIQNSYQVREFQIAGGPGWISTQGWDIEATPAAAISVDQRTQMLQTLLADRFHLAVHHETKQLPVYDLVLAKGGSKLQPSGDEQCCMITDAGSFTAKKTTLSIFASVLSGMLGRKVIDKTALAGTFEIDLKWTPDVKLNDDKSDDGGPSIFTAMQEQLGLRLEASKGPVDVLVIDRAEKPSEN